MEDWNAMAGLLENDFRLIAVDSRGQGKSTLGSEKLSYQLIQEDIEALLLHIGVNDAYVMGFSDGGIAAYRMAISGKIRVTKLVTVGSRAMRDDLVRLSPVFQPITAESWKQKFPKAYESYMQHNPAPDFDRLAEAVKAMWLDTSAAGYPDQAVKQITCPTLIIRGDKDHLFFRDSAATMANMLPDANLLNLPFAGHEVQKEEPELLGRLVKKFLLGA